MTDDKNQEKNGDDAAETNEVVVTPPPDAQEKGPSSPPPSDTRPSSGGMVRLLAGVGLVLSFLAILGLVAVLTGRLKVPGGSEATGSDLSPQVAALQSRVDSLETRLAELGQQVDAASGTTGSSLANDLQDMESRIQQLARDFAAQAAVGPTEGIVSTPEADQAIAALRSRLLQLEQDKGSEATIEETDLAQLREQVSGFRQSLSTMTDRFESLNREFAANDVRLDQLEENAPPEDLDQILSSLTPKSDVDFLTSRLERLEKFNTIDAAHRAVTALAAAELARATRGSDPFVKELDAFSTIAPGDPSARELRSYAVSGVATTETLSSRFDAIVEQAIEAEKRAGRQSLLGRLWASFLTLFDIRPVGEVEGETTKAVIARAEQRVSDGDLHAAAAELKHLAGAASDVTAPWVESVDQRDRVDRLIVALTARVFASLDEAMETAPQEGATP